MRLKGKVAIITGGGKGIGKSISLIFASEGASIVVAARSLPALESVVSQIKDQGGQAMAVQTDITVEKQVEEMVAETIRRFGRIDVLVNNSGTIGPIANIIDMNLADWNAVIESNLTGAMICTREVLKHMVLNRSGSIVNIGSAAGMSGTPSRSAYCVSKFGIIGLTETAAIEVGEYNIRVNCISPAAKGSEAFKESARARAKGLGISPEEWMIKFNRLFSLKRIPVPSEIASAAVFLASDEASGITGANLVVSCGYHILQPSEIA